MKTISIKVTVSEFQAIKNGARDGAYKSRSDFIRHAFLRHLALTRNPIIIASREKHPARRRLTRTQRIQEISRGKR